MPFGSYCSFVLGSAGIHLHTNTTVQCYLRWSNISRPDNSFFFCGIKPRMSRTLLPMWTFKFEIWPDKVNFTTLSERIQGGRPSAAILYFYSSPLHWANLLTQPKQNIHFLKHKQRFSVSLKSKLCLFCASSMFVFVQFWNGSEQRNTVSLWLTK